MDKTILVVDDSTVVRKSLSILLGGMGYGVLTAEDTPTALDTVEKTDIPIDLFIVDINMPGLNGIEFVKLLRAKDNHKSTPVFILTTESDPKMAAEAKAAGATAWMIKPYKEKVMKAGLMKVFKKKK